MKRWFLKQIDQYTSYSYSFLVVMGGLIAGQVAGHFAWWTQVLAVIGIIAAAVLVSEIVRDVAGLPRQPSRGARK